jgi:hypothetical protein
VPKADQKGLVLGRVSKVKYGEVGKNNEATTTPYKLSTSDFKNGRYNLCFQHANLYQGESQMKRLLFAAITVVVAVSYTSSLQAQTSAQTTKSSTKTETAKNAGAPKQPRGSGCRSAAGKMSGKPC